MAAVQTRALTSHLRARNTGKVSGLGRAEETFTTLVQLFPQRQCGTARIFAIYYFVPEEGGLHCSLEE